MFGVLRLLDEHGTIVDAAPYFGGQVQFGTVVRTTKPTAVRLDSADGRQITLPLNWEPLLLADDRISVVLPARFKP